MDASKTRIWNRGELGLPDAEPASEPSTQAASVAQASPLRAAAAVQRPPPLQATRVMPIERLLPQTPAARPARPARRLLLRVGGHLLLALLTLLAVAAWQLPGLMRATPAREQPSAAEPAPALQAKASASRAPVPEASTLVHSGPTPRADVHAAYMLERRAVDLVIAGDYAAARAAYEALARAQSAPAFREAARILAARSAPATQGTE